MPGAPWTYSTHEELISARMARVAVLITPTDRITGGFPAGETLHRIWWDQINQTYLIGWGEQEGYSQLDYFEKEVVSAEYVAFNDEGERFRNGNGREHNDGRILQFLPEHPKGPRYPDRNAGVPDLSRACSSRNATHGWSLGQNRRT